MRLLSIACCLVAACYTQPADTLKDRKAGELARPLNMPGPEKGQTVARVFNCGDVDLNDQLTSDGHPVTTWQPCWNDNVILGEHDPAQVSSGEARSEAAQHSEAVAQTDVTQVAPAACTGIAATEQMRSPFSHRREIAEVIPHRVAGQLAGVTVVFKPVPGLSADWMRKDIECHRARWAQAGKDPTVNLDDPTLVDGAQVHVSQYQGRITVQITTPTPEQAQAALARAQTAAKPPTQTAHR